MKSETYTFVVFAGIFLKIFTKCHQHFEAEIFANFWHFSILADIADKKKVELPKLC